MPNKNIRYCQIVILFYLIIEYIVLIPSIKLVCIRFVCLSLLDVPEVGKQWSWIFFFFCLHVSQNTSDTIFLYNMDCSPRCVWLSRPASVQWVTYLTGSSKTRFIAFLNNWRCKKLVKIRQNSPLI